MFKNRRMMFLMLAAVLILGIFSGCVESSEKQDPSTGGFSPFQGIPLSAEQRSWLIFGAFLCVTTLAIVFFVRGRNAGKHFEELVKIRTNELAVQTSTLQTTVDSIPDIIFCKDLNLRYTLCNKYMMDFFGLKKNDIIGKDKINDYKLPFEMTEISFYTDQRVINEGRRIMYEESNFSASGELLRFETIKAPLKQDGKVIGIVGISHDITQRKAMEEEALAASRSKTAFLANMSHEMRTPMNVVVGLTDLMMEDDGLPSNLRDNLKKISTAGSTLLGLINNVLDISKIESGRFELIPVEYDIPNLLSEVVALNMIRIEDKPITFKLDINGELPNSLCGDDLRLKQIINNLLSNAFKYTQKGTVTLGMSCLPDRSQVARSGRDMWMSVYVSDTGMGIREEDVKKLFTDYSQVDTRTNRTIEGTGLGLSITKMLVENMGGEISVESDYGKGSTFRFRLRQGSTSDKVIGEETAGKLRSFNYLDNRKGTNEKLSRPDLSYAKVLVVDDMQTNLDVATGMLQKYKMQVDCVKSGKDAIDLIKKGEPVFNAIFMDHMMPGMDGVEATEKIRAIGTKYAVEIPIIALTANAIAGNEQMFLSKDFQAFLTKPINIMNLDSIIQQWVRDKSRE